MFRKISTALAVAIAVCALPFVVGGISASDSAAGPCVCCGESCACRDCKCDAEKCDCANGGECACTPECHESGGCSHCAS